MENQIMQIASSQGIWTTLSFFLIMYIFKNQDRRDQIQAQREEKYQSIISSLSEKMQVIEGIKDDVSDIKQHIFKN